MGESEGTDNRDNKETPRRPDNKPESEGVIRTENQTIILDEWQKKILETKGLQNLAIRAGRQVGKSTVISILASRYAIENKKSSIMVISSTERQAFLLFSKILDYLLKNAKSYIKKGKDRPTKSEIKLNNGSIIRCLPTGTDGLGIRGYTIHLLIADEAAFIPQDVYPAVTPALSTTGGKIILLSTPYGRKGYFYDCFNDPSFTTVHINAEDIAESRPEPYRTNMQEHQAREKLRMSKLQYAQEYLGEFVDELRQFFNDELIKMVCTAKRETLRHNPLLFLGVDIARMGNDETTYEIIDKRNDKEFIHVESVIQTKKYTTETHDKIVQLNKIYDFKRIGIDAGSGSLGVGIYDFLIRDPEIKRRVVELNNAKRELDHLGEKKKSLLKEDMYFNLLSLMEKGFIKLLNDDEVMLSLKSVQYEYVLDPKRKSKIRIFGDYTHIVEGIIRAVWLANQKSLNAAIYYI